MQDTLLFQISAWVGMVVITSTIAGVLAYLAACIILIRKEGRERAKEQEIIDNILNGTE